MKVAASLLGPAATTLAVVQATLDALKSMSADSPWITLFNRESQSAKTARFQVTAGRTGRGRPIPGLPDGLWDRGPGNAHAGAIFQIQV